MMCCKCDNEIYSPYADRAKTNCDKLCIDCINERINKGSKVMDKVKVAVFASGSGTGLEAILKASKLGIAPIQVEFVILDRFCPARHVAERYGVFKSVVERSAFDNKTKFEEAILSNLASYDIDYIVLAGYMRLLGYMILDKYKAVNVHPSILPSFKGAHAVQQAIDYGCKVTGFTIHWADPGMDTGKIIYQDTVTIKDEDTEATLWERIKLLEHIMYPYIIGLLPQIEKMDKGEIDPVLWYGCSGRIYRAPGLFKSSLND